MLEEPVYPICFQQFINCKYQATCCSCIEKNAYESIAGERFYVYDEENNENPVRLAKPEEPFQLTVNNSDLKNVCLVRMTQPQLFASKTRSRI